MSNHIEEEIDLTHDLSPEMEEKLKEAFQIFDADGSGNIDAEEFKAILEGVTQEEYSIEEIQKIIETVDSDNSGEMRLDQFLKLMDNQMSTKENKDEEIVALFKSFGPDCNTDVITIGQLADALKEGGDVLKPEELNEIFVELAGSTKRSTLSAEKKFERAQGITFHDFMAMMLPK